MVVKVQTLDLVLSVLSYYSSVCLLTLEVLAFQCDVISNMDIGAIAKVKNKLRKLSVKFYVVLSYYDYENVFIRTSRASNWIFWQNIVDDIARSRSLIWYNYRRNCATAGMCSFMCNNGNTRPVYEVLHQNVFGVLSVNFVISIATLNKLMLIGVFLNWYTN